MIQTMTTAQIADALRADENAAWSYNGARALAEHLEQWEEETGQPMEFDRVEIRCDWSEYNSAREAAANYDWQPEEDADEDEAEASALKYMQDRTIVVEFDGGIIARDF